MRKKEMNSVRQRRRKKALHTDWIEHTMSRTKIKIGSGAGLEERGKVMKWMREIKKTERNT